MGNDILKEILPVIGTVVSNIFKRMFTFPQMSDDEFERLRRFIYEHLGISISPAKKTMLQARLQKRLRHLNLNSFEEYCNYLFRLKGIESEFPELVDAVTTNTTEFFREPNHFDFLVNSILPLWLNTYGYERAMLLWSAGCSSGEEPYSLAMVLQDFAEKNPGFNFLILATDINNKVLQKAVKAIYPEEKALKIPLSLKKKYLLRSRDRSKKLVRIAPEIRTKVRFRRLNFVREFKFRKQMDIIFCRNVFIYFDRITQKRVILRFCSYLMRGGYLFLGHSESLSGMQLPLMQVAPSVYQKIG
ncbi:protein-glutamate O-methyltransferase CheR [Desulfohalobiaceae bacterium Ax17]|uniref:CheR family methyltransferase n=1 Tax=Desulfovulcanus ferrireducens TaxID=2831190 RepID=UPI00207BCF93|nr:protein-glutamate O-methyltransferase CheR [Desulfovulcanus ferrireducens]MBT8763883.1 protein-glutamate O-methyltransferase CheR [Desulfovulcanus ferrireducens]